MFLLPPSNDGQSLPIDVFESSQIWESLLRLCYRVDDPSFQDIDAITDVLAAAIKYEFPYAIKFMRKELQSYIPSNALDVFAIAYRLDFLEEAKGAASSLHQEIRRATPVKTGAMIEWPSTLEGKAFSPKIQSLLSAGDLFRLLKYLRTEPLSNFSFCDPIPAKSAPQPTLQVDLGFDTSDADLILKSSDDVEFRVHKLIIFMASANHLCNAPIESEIDSDTLPVICLSENSATLGTLISMCYPIQDVDFSEDVSVVHVLKAAMKFEMKKVIQTVRVKLAHYIEKDPLRIYFTCIAVGLKEEAIKASKVFALSSDDSANSYVHEMEIAPAIAYHRLLKYRYQCRAVEIKRWDSYSPARFQSGAITMGTIALPVMELELVRQRGSFYSTAVRESFALVEKSNGILREIEDSIAKVLQIHRLCWLRF